MRFVIFLLFFPLFAGAQDLENRLLWRITQANSVDTSYVFGTVHSSDARAFSHAAVPLALIPRLDAVVGEVDIDMDKKQALALWSLMKLPDGKHLEDLYSKKEYTRIMKKLKEELGVLAYMTTSVKPFYIMAMLTDSMMKKDSTHMLDDYLQRRARSHGKQVLGLEKIEDQTNAVDRIPLKAQADMLLDMIDHDLERDELEKMMTAYVAEDLKTVESMSAVGTEDPAVVEALLDQRNPHMVEEMDRLMKSGLTCLFAVGAGHLPGSGGLVLRLRGMGYAVEPVE